MISGEHRTWGQNYQQNWIEDAWRSGFNSAYARMMEEAQALGAHGVVGVIDSENPLSDTGVVEFHLRGTAVRAIDAPPPSETPWSTFLAGQRLAKVLRGGIRAGVDRHVGRLGEDVGVLRHRISDGGQRGHVV